MKKFILIYLLFWVAVSLLYLASCFDGGYSERLYSLVESITFPAGFITAKWGIALETRYKFSVQIFLARLLLEIGIPALFDFGVIYGAVLLWRRRRVPSQT